MIARWIRAWYGKIFRPFFVLMGRWGITPNMLTISGLGAVVLSGFILSRGHIRLAGMVFLFGALLDGMDGELARVSGAETAFGAFVDSISDHCGDFAFYFGLLWLSLERNMRVDIVLIFVAAFGSLFGSQVRSRAGMVGIDTKNIGIFTRFERITVLALGLFMGRITIALWILAVMNNFTALQRIFHVVASVGKARTGLEK